MKRRREGNEENATRAKIGDVNLKISISIVAGKKTNFEKCVCIDENFERCVCIDEHRGQIKIKSRC
jgi:hypothetical protein